MFRFLIACGTLFLVLVTSASVATSAPRQLPYTYPTRAQMKAAEREAIRQLPILQRPSRPGHFYGNTVRRLNNR